MSRLTLLPAASWTYQSFVLTSVFSMSIELSAATLIFWVKSSNPLREGGKELPRLDPALLLLGQRCPL